MASMDMKWIKCIIMVTLSFACYTKGIEAQKADPVSQLIASLFSNPSQKYDSNQSPAISYEDPLAVNISLTIKDVYDLDEVTGTLTLDGLLAIMWTDNRLVWNPANTGLQNKSFINIPAHYFWIPDLTLENYAHGFTTSSGYISRHDIALYSNGKTDWTFPVSLSAGCQIDHRKFPFDEHACELRLISQNRNTKIIFHKISKNNHHGAHGEDSALRKSNSNPVWTISKQTSEIIRSHKRKHDDHQTAYQYTVHLRRRAPGQKFIILMPTVLAMGLTLSIFWLPPGSSQRMTLGGMAVLIFLTLLLYIGSKVPSGGHHIPSIAVFCGVSLLMTGISLIISVIVSQLNTINVYRPVPKVLKSFLGRRRIRQLLCLNFVTYKMGDDGIQLMRNTTDATNETQPPNCTSEADHTNELASTDWKLMAYATDRISFIIYCFTFVILLLSFSK